MKKKLKGVLSIEAAMVLPVFIVVMLSIVVNIRLITLRGVLHTATTSAMESVNRASQIINVLECVDDALGCVPTDTQTILFSGYICDAGEELEYSEDARRVYSEIGYISNEGRIKLLKQVLEDAIHNNMRDFVSTSFTSRVITVDDIRVTGFELTEYDNYKYVSCKVEYHFHFPFAIVGDQDKTGVQEMIIYLE